MTELKSKHAHITGIVQGVGFRPFVYSLATGMGLKGWVRNTSAGVDIEVTGPEARLERFFHEIREHPPPLARIDSLEIDVGAENGHTEFAILQSEPRSGDFIPVSPDVGMCADCRRELFDPQDRRYFYPFINCTNCGPRFTIIRDIPYDRPLTTMAAFEMCPSCREEYEDPTDRRFHAQPVACPVCGPQIWLEEDGRPAVRKDSAAVIHAARQLLADGKILAIKGLGGFHLACDATNPRAVNELRRRKLRREKPFALMLPNLEAVASHCHLSAAAVDLLKSPAQPVVVLQRREESSITQFVAPGQSTLGVMLPYTPLHALLLHDLPAPVLVMTSGNISEEPIAHTNFEARSRLAPLADGFLLHDRDIHVRCDDSVVTLAAGDRPYPLRRSRGYAPDPLRLPFAAPPLLATGAELKNTFCLTRDRYAFLSHHVGDLENYETLVSFEKGIEHFERLFRIRPQVLAYDIHPDYFSTRYAIARALRECVPAYGVQHHHAHIAACLAENGYVGDEPVIGVAFDGTGYGDDGAIWGGEFLLAGYSDYERAAHLAYMPLPGGDAAVKEPWRIVLGALRQMDIPWLSWLPSVAGRDQEALSVLARQLEIDLNVAKTSSMGRLFDAVSALIGVRQVVNYEAQAAVELENLVDPDESGSYEFDILPDGIIDPAPVFTDLFGDLSNHAPKPVMAARFHHAVAEMVLQVCLKLNARTGIRHVALSGGVWQNTTLLGEAHSLLTRSGFDVLLHRRVPANDGGLALGQAAIAANHFKDLKE